jgi:hypothetical protein
MCIRTLTVASLIAVSALGTVYAADRPASDGAPAQRGDRGERRGPPVSLERFAMENAIAERLAQQTGRSTSEIAALLAKQRPREVAHTLGVDDATMKSLCDAARQSVIAKAQDAQLITADQAAKLKSEPFPRHRHRPMDGDDQGPPPDDGN